MAIGFIIVGIVLFTIFTLVYCTNRNQPINRTDDRKVMPDFHVELQDQNDEEAQHEEDDSIGRLPNPKSANRMLTDSNANAPDARMEAHSRPLSNLSEMQALKATATTDTRLLSANSRDPKTTQHDVSERQDQSVTQGHADS